MSIPMSCEQRCRHLPLLFQEFDSPSPFWPACGRKGTISTNAADTALSASAWIYGCDVNRRVPGRCRSASFTPCRKNLGTIDYSLLLIGLMTIADEIDFQLVQAITRYTTEARQARFCPASPVALMSA